MVQRDSEKDKEGVVQLAVCVCEQWRMGADVGGQGMGVQADTTQLSVYVCVWVECVEDGCSPRAVGCVVWVTG